MSKNKHWIIMVGVLSLLVVETVALCYLLFRQTQSDHTSYTFHEPAAMYLEYQDILEEIELEDIEGNIIKNLPQHGKITVLTYISSSCSSCINFLSDFKRFSAVFGDTVDYVFIWFDDIPTKLIKKYSIDPEINYSVKEKVKLSSATPTFFILNERMEVMFKDVDRENLTSKLLGLDLLSHDEICENANQYIKENYFGRFPNKKQLVYFNMSDCSDCLEADAILKEADIRDYYDIAYIYIDNSTDESQIIDKGKLFALVYDIRWYPSFLTFDNTTYRIIGKTPTDKLLDELLNKR